MFIWTEANACTGGQEKQFENGDRTDPAKPTPRFADPFLPELAKGGNARQWLFLAVAAQSGVVAIAAGVAHTVALKSDGSVISWGDLGQTTVPVGLPPALAIAAGEDFTVALVGDPAPSLTLLRNADQTLNLSWRGAGALEQTESLTAPNWQPAPNQNNPQILSTTGAMKFYRVKAE